MIDASQARANALITSISTNAPSSHEIDPAMLGELDVYCDYLPSAGAVSEFTLATNAGTWSRADIRGDLPSLLNGSAPVPSRERAAFFRSIGLGLEDTAIARLAMLGMSAKP